MRNSQKEGFLRIGIVLSSEVYRESLGLLLSSIKGIGGPDNPRLFSDAEELRQAVSPFFDILILDEYSWEVAEEMRSDYPYCNLLLLTHKISSELMDTIYANGDGAGRGYLIWKDLTTREALISDLWGLANGGAILSSSVIQAYIDTTFGGMSYRSRLQRSLTRREIEVLELIASGYKNNRIASTLYVQPRTVEHYINSIFAKMGLDAGSQDTDARVAAVLLHINRKVHTEEVEEVRKLHED